MLRTVCLRAQQPCQTPPPQIWSLFIFATGLYALLSGSAQIGMACYLLIQGELRGTFQPHPAGTLQL